ncbi:hypothetical protein [Cupriavidus gilardii]|uniref:hypothetical protein n=1 Tax=Cupriavidus gilardii TaxID=82541 RepID=UPI0021B35234|nr:hypothetical protein [Cupriavidus gilardii]UXC37330.1 hypothetical protein N4G38_07805 [Cupriavidus gilardii]
MKNRTAQVGPVGTPTPRTVANNVESLKVAGAGGTTVSDHLALDRYPGFLNDEVSAAACAGKMPGHLTARLVRMLERTMAVSAGTEVVQRIALNAGAEDDCEGGQLPLNRCSVSQLTMLSLEANAMLYDAAESLALDLIRAFPPAEVSHG